jgi:hypothetical protein
MVMAPLALFVARKQNVLNRRSDLLGEHAKLAEKLFSTNDRIEAERIVEEMERIYDEIDETAKPIAFADRVAKELPMADDRTKELRQWEYMLAAQYGDLWCEVLDAKCRRIAAFITYFVRLAGMRGRLADLTWGQQTGAGCMRTPLQPKQRWYCNCCTAKFRTAFGIVRDSPPAVQVRSKRHVVVHALHGAGYRRGGHQGHADRR